MSDSITTAGVVVLQSNIQSTGVKLITPKDGDENWKQGKRYIQYMFPLPPGTYPYAVDVICSDAFGPDETFFSVGVTNDEIFYIPKTEMNSSGRWGLDPEKVLLGSHGSVKLTVSKGREVTHGILYFNVDFRYVEAI